MSASDRVDGFYRITFEGERCIGHRRFIDGVTETYESWTVLHKSRFGGGVASTTVDDLPDEAIGERIKL
jgi:hypothetical protein